MNATTLQILVIVALLGVVLATMLFFKACTVAAARLQRVQRINRSLKTMKEHVELMHESHQHLLGQKTDS